MTRQKGSCFEVLPDLSDLLFNFAVHIRISNRRSQRSQRGRFTVSHASNKSQPLDDPDGTTRFSPVIEPGHTYASVTDHISAIVLTRPTSNGWIFGFAISFLLLMAFLHATAYLFYRGVGIWGT